MNQIELHNKIDKLVASSPRNIKPSTVSMLIFTNDDARQYFYTQVNELWLEWLWEKGFLEILKENAKDFQKYSYRTPEINYIVRMAEKAPSKVVDIILSIPITSDNYNPEVIDKFIRVCSVLPADQLARVVPKIHDENWMRIMGNLNDWGFKYEKILQTLKDAGYYQNILMLSDTLLSIRSRNEMGVGRRDIAFSNPFYFDGLIHTKVFIHLATIPEDYVENAFKLVTNVMGEIIYTISEKRDDVAFAFYDKYLLADVDYFDIEPTSEDRLSVREDIKELAAVMVILSKRLIEEKCKNDDLVKWYYSTYVKKLPDSMSLWRFKLYVLSLCPKSLKEEIRISLFRLFKEQHYQDVIAGAEYERALRKTFSHLDEGDKRNYVRRLIDLFSQQGVDSNDINRIKKSASNILSMIIKNLTKAEKRRIQELGFSLNPEHKPVPSIGGATGGFVRPRGRISQEEFRKMSIPDIIEDLKSKWSPENLRKENDENFLNPLNADGIGNQLRADIAERLPDYIKHAKHFFDRNKLHPHYTYSYLIGIHDAIKNLKGELLQMEWERLFDLFGTIKHSNEINPFSPGQRMRDSIYPWLSDWRSVHSAIADVINVFIEERNNKKSIEFFNYRDRLMEIIEYLLYHTDPTQIDEEPNTTIITRRSPPDRKPLVSDPYTIAINSVRGRAFQAFVLFVFQDGKKYTKSANVKIEYDVKELYKEVLRREGTKAIMFLFGYYIPIFYYRDKEFVVSLLPLIFPEEENKRLLYIAATEGYLANNLHLEMFEDSYFQKLYKRALLEADLMDPVRKFYKDPEEGLATHFALAYLHIDDFGYSHHLFKLFWEKGNVKKQSLFIKYIGKYLFSDESSKVWKLFENKKRTKTKLENLWDRILNEINESELLIQFGYWIRADIRIFDTEWLANRLVKTLERTRGRLSRDYGFKKSIVLFAKQAPKETVLILRYYLLDWSVKRSKHQRLIYTENEWYEAIRILYENPDTREEAFYLIDDLIREGGRAFWKLKDILTETRVR
jgi:hypothetical protein